MLELAFLFRVTLVQLKKEQIIILHTFDRYKKNMVCFIIHIRQRFIELHDVVGIETGEKHKCDTYAFDIL
ncbi:MAG TPA: hypothetical protein DEB70_08430 [Planctomycetaceae bacterium]|nr:hypothetical protein [Planctomycetaceae bacterium]